MQPAEVVENTAFGVEQANMLVEHDNASLGSAHLAGNGCKQTGGDAQERSLARAVRSLQDDAFRPANTQSSWAKAPISHFGHNAIHDKDVDTGWQAARVQHNRQGCEVENPASGSGPSRTLVKERSQSQKSRQKRQG